MKNSKWGKAPNTNADSLQNAKWKVVATDRSWDHFPRRSAPTQSGVALRLPPHSTLEGSSFVSRMTVKYPVGKFCRVGSGLYHSVPLCTGLYRIIPHYAANIQHRTPNGEI